MKAKLQSNALPHLGELELAVLRMLWQKPHQDAKTLWATFPDSRDISVNTVQSTLERLFRKQLLQRHKVGRAYLYAPQVSKGEFIGRLLGGVITTVHSGSMSPILSGFVDFADSVSEDTLLELEQLVAQRKAERDGGRND